MNTQTQPNSTTNTVDTFEGFAIVELFGHNVVAGFVSEQTIAGNAMLRIDVPAVDGQPAYTKFYGHAAIYAITPTDEETATVAAGNLRTRPVDLWIVPEQKALPAPMTYEDERDDYDADTEDDDDSEDEEEIQL